MTERARSARPAKRIAESTTKRVIKSARPARKATNYIQKAVLSAMIRIEVINQRIQALDYALNGRLDRYGRDMGDAAAATDGLRAHLYQELSNAYREMLMFGVIAGGELMQEAKFKAYEHYLTHRHDVSYYLNPHSAYGGYWKEEEQELFRAQIDAAVECSEEHDGRECDRPITLANLHATHRELEEARRNLAELEERYHAVVSEFATMDRKEPEE